MLGLRPTLALVSLATLMLGTACSRTPATDEAVATVEARSSSDATELDRGAMISLALTLEPDAPQRAALVHQLRAAGPTGLDALIDEYERVPERSTEDHQAWRGLIDAVAQQRDARYGGIYWYRDMNEARAVAEASGKPILSLRLLGELTSEYSCANSRLFRTLLYADPELATWLERNFVMHWSSERPVPKIEIDFGDGRTLTRTITGNSAHFVLDSRGRTIDVIPGLVAASSFRAALSDSLELHATLATETRERRWRAVLAEQHQRRFAAGSSRLIDALVQLRDLAPNNTEAEAEAEAVEAWLRRSPNPSRGPVAAAQAVPMAIGKSRMEAPVLAAATGQLGKAAAPAPFIAPTDTELATLGRRVTGGVVLHPNSATIIAAEHPLDGLDGLVEDRAAAELALRARLIESIEADTGKNLLEMHTRVALELARRASEGESLGFADVDEWVYSELFQTPASDPWLGLVDPEVYTALTASGLVKI